MSNVTPIGARLGISGVLECKDATGAVIKTIEIKGSLPLSDLGITEQQARQLIEETHGTDHRQ